MTSRPSRWKKCSRIWACRDLFNVSIKNSAKKELAGIPHPFNRQIAERLRSLVSNPFPNGYLKLQGHDFAYRIRSGDYRILYTINGNDVEVFAIGHRKDVYR